MTSRGMSQSAAEVCDASLVRTARDGEYSTSLIGLTKRTKSGHVNNLAV